MVNRLTASASDGVFYFRLEDTDKKREVAGGAEDILTGLNAYGLTIDEGFVAPGEVRALTARISRANGWPSTNATSSPWWKRG